jgi:hypothetical protein
MCKLTKKIDCFIVGHRYEKNLETKAGTDEYVIVERCEDCGMVKKNG